MLGGTIRIAQCYEGLEGLTVAISGGEIDVVSSDDGSNAAGGSDGEAQGPMGADQFAVNGDAYICLLYTSFVRVFSKAAQALLPKKNSPKNGLS